MTWDVSRDLARVSRDLRVVARDLGVVSTFFFFYAQTLRRGSNIAPIKTESKKQKHVIVAGRGETWCCEGCQSYVLYSM